jgi:hypothetical protein
VRGRKAGRFKTTVATKFLYLSFIVMSSAGGFGPDARKFLKFLYKSSRERNCWEIGSGQPQIQSTWNTLLASIYWDMRLSMACTAISAEVVGRIIARDFNLNLVTDGPRQPLSDPNSPAYGKPHSDPNSPAYGNLRRGGVIVEPSRSFLGSGEVAAVCGLLLHS